jgi:hypothetical protein
MKKRLPEESVESVVRQKRKLKKNKLLKKLSYFKFKEDHINCFDSFQFRAEIHQAL